MSGCRDRFLKHKLQENFLKIFLSGGGEVMKEVDELSNTVSLKWRQERIDILMNRIEVLRQYRTNLVEQLRGVSRKVSEKPPKNPLDLFKWYEDKAAAESAVGARNSLKIIDELLEESMREFKALNKPSSAVRHNTGGKVR